MKLLASLSIRQKVATAAVVLLAAAGLYYLARWRREADFHPLFNGLAAEDASGIVQKLKEEGIPFRLSADGSSVLAPSARIPELRIAMAAADLPRTGRIGFELFDKTNLGATEFAERVNYRRALEGELERSVMALAEVEMARVHITFPKESVFLDDQQPAKASVLVRLRAGAHLAPRNVAAIDNLVASAVEGLAPDAVSVVDMNGNLLGKPKQPGTGDPEETSEAALDYRRRLEADLLAKIGATLEPLLGAQRFHAGASVDCDFSGGEQSEEIFDPSRSVMVTSQRTEDSSGASGAGGAPGTASSLPRPAARPAGSGSRGARVTEDITYQTSRTVKKVKLPAGQVRKISLAVLLDQDVQWDKQNGGYQRVLVPPTPEKLKIVHDLVAGVTGLNMERGDQLIVETLPFETTLLTEPPAAPAVPAAPASPSKGPFQLDRKTLTMAGAAAAALLLLSMAGAVLMRRSRRARRPSPAAESPTALPAGSEAGGAVVRTGSPADGEKALTGAERQLEVRLAEQEAAQKRMDAQALNSLKLAPPITKTSEVLARHLREKIKQAPDVPSQILLSWIREEGG